MTSPDSTTPNRLPRSAAAWLAAALVLFAANAGAAFQVHSPIVEQDETEIELTGHVIKDDNDAVDGSQEISFAVGRGLTARWFSEIEMEMEKTSGEDLETEALAWENILQLTEQGEYAVDFGLFAELELATESDAPDELVIGPLVEKEFGQLVLTGNLLFEKQFGDNAEDEIESAFSARALWRINPALEPAIEYFSAEDTQLLGAAIYGSAGTGDGKLKYELGLLIGLDDESPDQVLRWAVEYEF